VNWTPSAAMSAVAIGIELKMATATARNDWKANLELFEKIKNFTLYIREILTLKTCTYLK
jgi:hypothetical protein